MKKIINSKMYNTDTAVELGSYWNGYGRGDFNFYCETLYRKKNGEYFLYKEGGPLTSMVTYSGGNRCWGDDIVVFSEDDAKAWAVEKLKADEYEALFGEVAE